VSVTIGISTEGAHLDEPGDTGRLGSVDKGFGSTEVNRLVHFVPAWRGKQRRECDEVDNGIMSGESIPNAISVGARQVESDTTDSGGHVCVSGRAPEDGHIVTAGDQFPDEGGTDEAGTTSDEDLHTR